MKYSMEDINIGDMLWVELKGPDQNFGYGEVKEIWKDEETGFEYFEFSCLINGGQRSGRIDKIIEKPTLRMENKFLQCRREFREAMKDKR